MSTSSSNTSLPELDFNRYIVVKTDNLNYLSNHKQQMFLDLLTQIEDARSSHGLPPKRNHVVISETSTMFDGVVLALRQKLARNVCLEDWIIRTPADAQLWLVAQHFLPKKVFLNNDLRKYGGHPFLIGKGGDFIPWNPWNDFECAMHLAHAARIRTGYGDDGPHVEYWVQSDGKAKAEIMQVQSVKQHTEAGLTLAYARKITQVAVYLAHKALEAKKDV